MKMVKSLLLGSAAGLVAVTAGQAADLPVKARPVEYVKICSLYGAGFYYMPGTDLCIKIGGWVRAEAAAGAINGSMTWGPFAGNALQRTTSNFAYRARGYITADVRNQTEYGTARGYIAVGVSTGDTGLYGSPADPPSTFSSNRAFVQWAGMTAGVSQSFYDFYSVPAAQYRGGYLPASDTGDPGWMVWAYTAQFGGGFSATISAETRRVTQIIDQNNVIGLAGGGAGSVGNGSGGSLSPGSFFNGLTASCSASATSTTGGATTCAGAPTGAAALLPGAGAYGGEQVPDIVGNLRLDQAWGGAQIMGVAHEVNGSYYSTSNTTFSAPSILSGGHPGDQWGWAAGVGLKINFPSIAAGDYFQGQFNATQGAMRYLFFTQNSNYGMVNGNQEAYGVMTDCVYGGTPATGTSTGCNLTSAWGFNASYEHYWTPSWHQSLYGAYYSVSYDGQANAMLCSAAGFGTLVGSAATAAAGCTNNWSTWGIGSRLQWDVTKTFYLGVEVLYSQLNSAKTGSATGAIGGYTFGSATTEESSASSWMVSVRAHRDFLP